MKEKPIRIIINSFLVLTLLVSLVGIVSPNRASAAVVDGTASIQPTYDTDTHKWYGVAMMYYEIWTNNAGDWVTYKKGDTPSMDWDYQFSFPGRTIRDVNVRLFDPYNGKDMDYFNKSRVDPNEKYESKQLYISDNIKSAGKSDLTFTGTDTVNFKINITGKLNSITDLNVVSQECPTCGPGVVAYRYYFPVVIEFELNGQMVINHYKTDGTNLSAVFPQQRINMTVGNLYPLTVAETNPAYDYKGYKKSTTAAVPSGSISPGEIKKFTYDSLFDTYTLNYYYDDKSIDGKVIIKHFDLNDNSLDGIAGLSDKEQALKEGTAYSFTHDAPSSGSGYIYAGYKKSTSGLTPSGSINAPPAEYNLGTYTSAAIPNPVYLYYYYNPDSTVTAGEVNVRHLVRTGPNGTYKLAKEQKYLIASLPYSGSYNADSTYGTLQGSNLSFVAYSDTLTVKTSQAASLTSTLNKAYVTFFYEKQQDFTGDFDVVPNTIPYKDSFALHPKNFVLNGCIYISHKWKIERDGLSWISSAMTSRSQDTTFTYSGYPSIIGIGIHNVYLNITTSCGDSGWIGPKPLTVTGPTNNHPPTFQIGFVDPSKPTVIMHQATEGTVLDLVVIQDPTVPTPYDPDGDLLTFDGFDFTSGDSWVKSIPSKGLDHYLQYVHIPMDGPGMHNITASMRDPFGAVASASTYINIVPPNPIPVIDGPDKVVEGRPISEPFKGDRSYSPIAGRTINHSFDEWTNVKSIYTTVGKEYITLNVYDSLGLKSVSPAQHELTVLEDLPPIPVLEYPSPSVRNANVLFKNKSYSPDGDVIVQNNVSYRYDKDSDGNFAEEPIVPIALNAKNEFTFTPNRVGKYKFYVDLKEDWGKTANDVFDFQVINDAPSVNFDISTESKSPVPIVPIPIKGNVLVDPAGGWRNSDFKSASKISSWNYNATTGALVHSPTDFGRFSLNIAPTTNVTVKSTDDYHYASKFTYVSSWDLGNGYFVRAEPTQKYNTFAGTGMLSVYKFDSSGTSILVATHSDEATIFGIDFIHQLVYSGGYSYMGVPVSMHTYSMSSFLNSSGTPLSTSSTATINGVRRDVNFENDGNRSDKYLPSMFGDTFLREDYPSLYIHSYSRSFYNWGSETPYSTVDDGTNAVFYKSFGLPIFGQISDNKMNYYTYIDRYTSAAGGPFGYAIANPLKGTATVNRSSDLASDFLTTAAYPQTLIPTLDGKYVLSEEGKVYNAATGARMFSSPAGTTIYGVSVSGIAYGSNGGYLKGFRVEANGSLTQIWNSPFTPALNIRVIQDNSDGLITFETQSNSAQVSRVDLYTGNKVIIATIPRTGSETNYHVELTSDGQIRVELINDSGSDKFSKTYFISSTNKSFRNEALSSQNQLLGAEHLKNIVINYKMKMNLAVKEDIFSGFSFGSQDNSNMYRVEQNADRVQLVKVEGGHRTVIQSTPFAFNTNQAYQVKITALDNRIKVYVEGVPLIDKVDSTFGDGYFGPFSEIPRTEFSNMSYADLKDLSVTSKLQGVALVGQDMVYTITNDDTENDPMITVFTEWTYNKVKEKFLDAGDGESGPSAFSGNIYHTPVNQLDKVGVYDVSYKTVDDPNPDYLYPSSTFSSYRQSSNKAVRTLIVHRAPIVDYDLGLNPDHTVKWTDRSHDPDRYLSASNYSTEATGIDYLKTKGILEKKFYYITPSGDYYATKLVTPTELGTYTVGLAVKDEVRLVLL